jgi:hypothetical protein
MRKDAYAYDQRNYVTAKNLDELTSLHGGSRCLPLFHATLCLSQLEIIASNARGSKMADTLEGITGVLLHRGKPNSSLETWRRQTQLGSQNRNYVKSFQTGS